jgi:calpain
MNNSGLKFYLNQDYSKIKQECLSNNRLFVDNAFPANHESLTRFKRPEKNIVWKRPHEFGDKAPQFIVNDIAPNDIDQGSLGDW